MSNQVSEEKELLIRVSNGDENAFRILFDQWHQVLAGYIFRLTKSRQTTEEIVQDVFLKIWIMRKSLPRVQNLKQYLFVVSRNQAYDALKKRLKEEAVMKSSAKELEDLVTPAENEFSKSWQAAVDMAIDRLPRRRKEVYLLSRYEGLTYNEIGEKLGISRESVKTHLKLASNSITEFLQASKQRLIIISLILFKNL